MGSAPASALPAPSAPTGPTGPAVPAEERGGLRIADRALARIAAQAASEALAEHTPEPERLEFPRASADHGRRGLRIRLGIDLPYPVDIAAATGAVHHQVVGRLAELAGAEEPALALVVERLVLPETGGLR